MRKAGSAAGLVGVLAVAAVWFILSGAGAGSATGVAALDATGGPITQSLDCPDDDFEDENDSAQTATFSTIPFYREELRACPNDLDFYIFPLGSGDEIQIDAFFDHEEGNIQMSIFDQSGTFLDAANSTTDNEKLVFTAGVAGNYQLLVVLQLPDLGTAPGNTYTLQVGFPDGLCPDDDFENNDTEDTPVLTGIPIYLDGLRSCPGDDDYFSFSFLSGPAEINAFFTHAEGNLNLRLIDPNGMITTAFTTDDNEHIDLATTVPGVYRIGISNVDDLGSAAGNTYALQISQPGGLCPDDALEDDDVFEDATAVSLPYYQAGLRACPTDGDYFSFFASAGDELQIDLFFTAAEGELAMVLFDPDEDAVVANASTEFDNKKIVYTALETGIYTMFVINNVDEGTAVGNTYALQITGPKPTATPTPTATPPADADLIVKGIDVFPPKPEAGESIDLTVVVSNVGSAPAGEFFIDFYADLPGPPNLGEVGDFSCEVNGLAPGASINCVASGSFNNAGSFDMWAQVDTDEDVAESNEGNNVFGPQKLDVNEPGAPTFTPTATPTATPTPTTTPTATTPPTDTPQAGLVGDVNCNDVVNSIDASLLLQFGAGLFQFLLCEENADVNLDGFVNAIDATLILQFVADLISTLPP